MCLQSHQRKRFGLRCSLGSYFSKLVHYLSQEVFVGMSETKFLVRVWHKDTFWKKSGLSGSLRLTPHRSQELFWSRKDASVWYRLRNRFQHMCRASCYLFSDARVLLCAYQRDSKFPVLKHGPRIPHTFARTDSRPLYLKWRQQFGPLHERPVSLCENKYECERCCWNSKDGELYLGRMKSDESLMEVHSDTDVQIVRRIWI